MENFTMSKMITSVEATTEHIREDIVGQASLLIMYNIGR